ncbi:MAG: L-seryl-tRNA(Sec) selenium transferase [Deltaproteobacteria bacterium]|nr:L-seryl-tRNA(Sec) selenium transferase [Deltaproteobacteria bacterium]
MKLSETQQMLLRRLPGIDRMLELAKTDAFFQDVPISVVTKSARQVIESLRTAILENSAEMNEQGLSEAAVVERIRESVTRAMSLNLFRTINATGVVVHTNLGRSLLADEAIANLQIIAGRYSNLEFDINAGKRGSRYRAVEDILCEITGAEAAMAVNNNAAAVLLCLDTLAKGKEVVVSRGELVEIGGSFRIPDVMARTGAILKEVGTTNRTHLKDYAQAIQESTGLLLKVHTSNYRVTGFTASVSLSDLVSLGKTRGVAVMEDLGSGTLVDFSRFGMQKEPTVQESVASGADVITFSGDKLLGGPQAGIILGTRAILDSVKQNPLTRALRIDKLTLAALESTLRLYRDPERARQAIPTLRMLTMPMNEIQRRADQLCALLSDIGDLRLCLAQHALSSRAGGGSLPLLDIPTVCVGMQVTGVSTSAVESFLRHHTPPIIGRIEDDVFLMDVRTLQDDEMQWIQTAVAELLIRNKS